VRLLVGLLTPGPAAKTISQKQDMQLLVSNKCHADKVFCARNCAGDCITKA